MNQSSKKRLTLHLGINLSSNVWSGILLLVSTPVFIKVIGVEAYAMIGIYNVIFSFAILLDIGLSSTLSRELASIKSNNDVFRVLSIFKTLETLSLVLGIFAFIFIGLTIPLSINLWMGKHTLPDNTIKMVLQLISFLVGIRLPLSFYSAGILGLDKQVILNIFSMVSETLRILIPLIGFYFWGMGIVYFFVVQIAITIISIIIYRSFLLKSLPKISKPIKFSWSVIKSLYPYMKAIGLTNIFWLISAQLDKVVVMKLVSLETYGYYTIASSVATSLGGKFIMPVYQTFFPKLVANISDENKIRHLYHMASKVMTIINFPILITIAFWSDGIFRLWIGTSAHYVAPIASILVFFTILNAIKWVPYATQLAYGYINISLYGHILMCICLPIFMVVGFNLFQLKGVAYAVVCIYGIYIIFTQYFFHKKYLIGEQWRWYFEDIIVHFALFIIIVLITINIWGNNIKILLVPLFTYYILISFFYYYQTQYLKNE